MSVKAGGGVTIWHNPACGTSRNALAMIRASGVEPTVVDYLTTGWDRATLERLIAATAKVRGSCCARRARLPPTSAFWTQASAMTPSSRR